MRRVHFVNIILIIVLFTACDKEQNQWKKPVEVDIAIDMKRSSIASSHLTFNNGEVVLAAFSIEGERIQAEDFSFSKEFEQGLRVPFSPDLPVMELDFNIPQGTYTSINVSFSTYDDTSQPNLVVEGIYTNGSGTEVPIRFEFMSSEYFSLVAEDDDGLNTIILEKDIPAIGQIQLDPYYWFGVISTNRLDNATLTNVNGIQTLLITENKNADIYDDLADRIDEQTEMVFAPK